jgi:hypothetical protein
MEVGQTVWMIGVTSWGSDAPAVYMSARRITAIVGDKAVVDADFYETTIVDRDRLYPSKQAAAAAAISMLVDGRDKAIARYQAKIEEMEKICLHDVAASV